MSHPAEFWCARRLVVTVEGPQGRSVVPLARPFARIGREARSDIVLNSPWVARRSLYLHATDEGVYCFYLQPEERQGERLGFWLAPHEPLLVGPYRVSAALEGEEPAAAPALVPLDDWGSAPAPYPVLQVYSGGKLRDKRRFRARLNLIGRRHECALQVKGGHVSSFHGCLYWHNSRLWYVDLISSNGTLKNGEPFDFGRVRVGDQLEVGEFSLQFQRLSRSGSSGRTSAATVAVAAEQQPADMLPPDFEDELPIDLDAAAVNAACEQSGHVEDSLEGSPVIPLELPEEILVEPALAQTTLVDPAAHLQAPATELSVPAPVEQTRHELAALQRRVAELTQLTTQVGQQTAKQVVAKTRQTLEHERLRIQHELARRAAELSREKQALDAQWQTASRELATQVQELKSEATLLARQRQDMEQARLIWEAQRGELERQLRTYAQQLAYLQQGAAAGLPPPAGASDSEVATALVLAAAEARGGALTPRSHVVEARVEDAETDHGHINGAAHPGLPENGAAPSLPGAESHLGRLGGERFLEGSMEPAPAAAPAANGNHAETGAPRLPIRGRRIDKSKQVFDQVTDRLVELEADRRRLMLWLGVGGGIAVAVLSAAIIVLAVLLR